MSASLYLIDTSACNRLFRTPAVERHWAGILDEGRVSVCEITELELVRATGGRDERAVLERYLHDAFGWTPVPDRALTRARQVQDLLVTSSWHQGPGAVDLMTAATAELCGLTLLHYDADFETIAKVTGQPHQWIAPRGSVD
ncbi:PIN domain nuclease [Streptomyces sp. NPDC097640]|uniref:PIN domain nuclease n=1 Tax=Streptomyces sp. NPDC097640 TaxID=3157229 RepID=UPI00333444C2